MAHCVLCTQVCSIIYSNFWIFMNLSTIIEISGATLGFFSAVFFSVGVLHVKESTLIDIATLMWEDGATIAKELTLQKVDFIFGAILLVLSFLVQIFGKCLSPAISHSVVINSIFHGIAFGLIGPVVLVLFLYLPYCILRSSSVRRLSSKIKEKL